MQSLLQAFKLYLLYLQTIYLPEYKVVTNSKACLEPLLRQLSISTNNQTHPNLASFKVTFTSI